MGRWLLATLSLLIGVSWQPLAGSREPAAGSWKLEAGSWKPAAGSWKPAAGSWKPAAGSRQQPPPPQTFRSGAQIVQVDVRVHKDGKFVTDLGAADFEIKEDGVPQKVVSLVLINAGAAPALNAPQA